MDGQPQMFRKPRSFHCLRAENQGQYQETQPCLQSQITLEQVDFQSWHITKDVLLAVHVPPISLAGQRVPPHYCWSSAEEGSTETGDFLFPFGRLLCISLQHLPPLTPAQAVSTGGLWGTAALHPCTAGCGTTLLTRKRTRKHGLGTKHTLSVLQLKY